MVFRILTVGGLDIPLITEFPDFGVGLTRDHFFAIAEKAIDQHNADKSEDEEILPSSMWVQRLDCGINELYSVYNEEATLPVEKGDLVDAPPLESISPLSTKKN